MFEEKDYLIEITCDSCGKLFKTYSNLIANDWNCCDSCEKEFEEIDNKSQEQEKEAGERD